MYKISCLELACVAAQEGPEVLKLFSYLTQLSMKFILLINVKMPTIIVGILTFISRMIVSFGDLNLTFH